MSLRSRRCPLSMNDPEIIIIEPAMIGKRLDQFLAGTHPEHSRSFFHRLIKEQNVLINGQPAKSGYLLKEHDRISIEYPPVETSLIPAEIPLDILFEDEAIIVINKPAGMTVHPGKAAGSETLVHALLHHTDDLSEGGSPERPGIVHRLDKNTSGLLVIAKTDSAHRNLRRQFDEHTIHRTYWALVWGKMRDVAGEIRTLIERSRKDATRYVVSNRGREAITHYQVLQDFEYASLLEVRLETGRTHQIRVHLNHIHHPVIGDPDYHGRESQLKQLPVNLQRRGQHLLNLMQRQALHAKKLSFIHPISNQAMSFESDLPEDFKTALEKIPQLFLLD